jgi:hypothetical protein
MSLTRIVAVAVLVMAVLLMVAQFGPAVFTQG